MVLIMNIGIYMTIKILPLLVRDERTVGNILKKAS